MRNTERGFIKFFIFLLVVVGSLFFFHDKDGQSYAKKIIAMVTGTVDGIKDKTYEARDLMQAHQDDLKQSLEE